MMSIRLTNLVNAQNSVLEALDRAGIEHGLFDFDTKLVDVPASDLGPAVDALNAYGIETDYDDEIREARESSN